MSRDPSEALRDRLEPGEKLRWHERGAIEESRTQVRRLLAVGALPVAVVAAVAAGVLSEATLGRTALLESIVAGVLVAVGLVYAADVAVRRRLDAREYAVTDRRFLKGGGWLGRSFESVPWEDVEAVEFHPHDYQRIDLHTTGSLPFLGSVRLRCFDGHAVYEPLVRAWVEATGGPDLPDGVPDPLRRDRDSVSEPLASELDPDETVIWRATQPRPHTPHGGVAVAAFGVSLLALMVTGPVLGLPVVVAVGGAVAVAAVFAVGTYALHFAWVRRSWTRLEYVVTDRRFLATLGGEYETASIAEADDVRYLDDRAVAVRWDDAEAVQRRGDNVRVYTRDPTGIEPEGRRTERGLPPTKLPTLSLEVPETRRAYWALREADPAGVFGDDAGDRPVREAFDREGRRVER